MRPVLRIGILTAFFALSVSIYAAEVVITSSADPELRVVFLDVGQGDATFIESPAGTQVLIDGGPGSSVLRALSAEMGFFDRDLDMVIATHPDRDHVGGLVDVLERYEVDALMRTENQSDSSAANQFNRAVATEGAAQTYARRGDVVSLGGGATLHVLFPDRAVTELESNSSSIILQLRYGETEFLLTGDAPSGIEEYLLTLDGEKLESDVLKVGHHGSRTSTDVGFLRAVDPAHAVISAAAESRYGHPHEEVVDRLVDYGVKIKNTADAGSVVVVSDGTSVEVK